MQKIKKRQWGARYIKNKKTNIPSILYQSKNYTGLSLVFSRNNRIKDILAVLMELKIPLSQRDLGIWKFVVLELLTNSIQASVEKHSDERILVTLQISGEFFVTSIEDGAGGFDPPDPSLRHFLPPEKIDIFNEQFETYRLLHQYQGYGLGLYAAKKFTDEFELFFTDREGRKTILYQKDGLKGTTVIIKKENPKRRYPWKRIDFG